MPMPLGSWSRRSLVLLSGLLLLAALAGWVLAVDGDHSAPPRSRIIPPPGLHRAPYRPKPKDPTKFCCYIMPHLPKRPSVYALSP